jgi:hypothetical protein
LTLYRCAPPHSSSIHIDPALESLVPKDTILATGANIEAIRDTPVYQKYLSTVNLPQFEDFVKRTGVDPRKDLLEVLSCSNGKTGLFLARGKFDRDQLAARLEGAGASRFSYKKHDLFGNENSAVVFMSNTILAAGRTPDLRSLIDEQSQSDHGIPAALRAQVASIGAGNQIWAALTGGPQGVDFAVPRNSNLATAVQILRGIDSAAVGVDLRHGLDLEAKADCLSDRDAKRLHDALRGVIGFGRLSTPDNQPDLLKLYDAIKVAQQQTKVQVTAQVPPDLEEKFLDLWLKRH